ncbi:PKD domain-containing protein [Vicingaceae bacterium]|nr:PKD domain-containing protein [Vicingaceae bacterium]
MKKGNFILLIAISLLPFLAFAQPVDVSISQGTANTCNGILFDTGGQGGTGYSNNENFTITICADVPGDAITLIFNNFNLSGTNTATPPANNKDNLTIYDGNSTAAPTLGTYTDNSLQGLIVSATSANVTGCLTFVFNSNSAGTGVFSATITCTTPCQPPTALYTSPTVAQNPQLICQGETVAFDASGSFAEPTFTIVDYIFDYGDGVIDTLQTPNTTHAFANPGEYLVKLTVIDDNGCTNMNSEIITIWVSTTPYFNTIISDSLICLGETSCLDGGTDFTPVTYTPTPGTSLTGATYLPDDVGQCFSATLDYGFFIPGQTLTDIDDLLGIWVNMEHTFMGDLVATITCPNGTSVVLHQQNGGGTDLGDPDPGTDSLSIGVGWDYGWSPNAANGTWVDNAEFGATPNTVTNVNGNESLAPGLYESLNPLTPLVGCPLNGVWEIEFCDLWGGDDGFVFDFWLDLDPSLYPSLTTFTPSIGSLSDSTYWISNTPGNMGFVTSSTSDSNEICITPTVAGIHEYTFVANDNFGCTYDTTVSVIVAPNYTYIKNQTDSLVCLGEEVVFTINPTSVLPLTYAWEPANIFNDATLAAPTATIFTPGLTTVTVGMNNGADCIKTDTFEIYGTNVFKPDINIIPNDTTLNCGEPVNLDVDLGGGIPTVCGISPTNACTAPTSESIIGAGTTNLSTIPSPYYGGWEDSRVQIIYTAAELNAMGFAGGKITEVAFNVTNQSSTDPYQGFNIKMGCTATQDFNGATQFEPGLSLVYTNPSYSTIGGWNPHILDNAYEWDGTSNLIVEICFDNNDWTSSDQVAQTATAQPLTLREYTDGATGCTMNNQFNFSSEVNRPNIRLTHCPTVADPTDYTYAWTPGETLNDSTIQNPIGTPEVSTDYIVTVADLSGLCTDTDTIPVTVLISVTATADSVNVSCNGGTDGKIITNIVGTSFPFTVEYFDSLGTTLIQTNNTNSNTDSLTGLTIGTYIIKVSDISGCPAWDTISITEPTPVVITSLTQNATICIDGSIILEGTVTGGTGTDSLVWDHSLIGSGPHIATPIDSMTTYFVYGKDSLGCISETDSVVVLWSDSIRVDTLTSVTLCQDGAINSTPLTAVAIGGDGNGFTYQWFDGADTLISTNQTIDANPSTSPETFTVIVSDGCTTPSATTEVDIYLLPEFTPTFDTTMIDDGCVPVEINFTNTTDPTNIHSVNWDFGDGNISSSPLDVTHIYTSAGTYNVRLTVTNIAGCVEDTIYASHVTVNALPVPNFSYSPVAPTTFDTEITFENLSSNYASSYWTFTEGSPQNSSEEMPVVEFPSDEPGVYPVQLILISEAGCVDSTSGKFIQIDGVYLLFVPNAFTPNNDGLNDCFRPQGNDIELEDYSLAIYNRWGELLFETNTLSNCWDGTYKGSAVPNGVYVWKIRAKEKYSTIVHNDWGQVTIAK